MLTVLSVSTGSSPRVWGQVSCVLRCYLLFRIIPTRVGTRAIQTNGAFYTKDHPHACGDKYDCTLCRQHLIGSSPRVWGQDNSEIIIISMFRIIPTRVGTRSHNLLNPVVTEDHPHACGDKYNISNVDVDIKGSSPRVWGQVPSYFFAILCTWIIPTRVGTRFFLADSLRLM